VRRIRVICESGWVSKTEVITNSPEKNKGAEISLKFSLLQLHAIKSSRVIGRVIPEQVESLQNVECLMHIEAAGSHTICYWTEENHEKLLCCWCPGRIPNCVSSKYKSGALLLKQPSL
jgi:hypothetical protein